MLARPHDPPHPGLGRRAGLLVGLGCGALLLACGEDEPRTGAGSLNGALGLGGMPGPTTADADGGYDAGSTNGGDAGGLSGLNGLSGSPGGTTANTNGTTANTNGTTANTNGTTANTSGTSGTVGYYTDPVIPAVSGECPTFASGSFSFMGLTGEMAVGPKGTGDGALLFYWHGTGGTAGAYQYPSVGIGASNVQKITSTGGIVFAVQGETGSGDASCSGTAVFDGDFSVIDQVVACAVQNHAIDPRRIYATGCSAGGLQSGCMARRRADYVAAVAPNSGGLVTAYGASLANSVTGNVPASMTMHGGQDDTVLNLNFEDSSGYFNDMIVGAGGFAIDCNHMAGHCGAPSSLYDLAIDFLLDHPFGVDPEPYGGVPIGYPGYCTVQ